MKNPEIAKIFEEVEKGSISLEEANKRLMDAGAPYYLNPWKNKIGRNEQGVGLLDTGTGTLDKVRVRDGKLSNADCGAMPATCTYNGKLYRVHGDELGEVIEE